jgi:hypothetical protein
MSILLLVILIVLYFSGQYTLAFWAAIASIALNVLVVIRALVDEEWYLHQRNRARADIEFGKDHRIGLAITKAIIITLLALFAAHLFKLSGEIFNT